MAERRRRKCPENGNSDVGSDESGDEVLVLNSSNIGSDGVNSEYESVDEDELADDENLVEEEEEEGGELILGPDVLAGEPDPNKPLDHDEDRKNPQYIPKKGTFYEHDDRTVGEGEEIADNVSEKSAPQDPDTPNQTTTKKKVWKEDDKWQHDRFSVYDQSPKSREELVASYGYDIRNEEGPPRARRRRRYGRGPNKYTRNWEDLDAYSKPTRGGGVGGVGERGGGGGGGGGGRGRMKKNSFSANEEFPSLPPRSPKEGGGDMEDPQIESPSIPTTPIESPRMINNSNMYNVSENSKPGRGGGYGRGYVEDKMREPGPPGKGGRPTFPQPPRLFPPVTQPHLIGPPLGGPSIGGPPVAGPAVAVPPVPGTVGGQPVGGPPFLPPENLINYAAATPALVAAPHPPQFPAFQAFTPVSQQPPPQEIYSNGVMYYNTQTQHHLPRMNPGLHKRPKAAIPILPPPDRQSYDYEMLSNREQDEYDEGSRDFYQYPDNHIDIDSSYSETETADFTAEGSINDRSNEEVVSASEDVVSSSEETYELAPSDSIEEREEMKELSRVETVSVVSNVTEESISESNSTNPCLEKEVSLNEDSVSTANDDKESPSELPSPSDAEVKETIEERERDEEPSLNGESHDTKTASPVTEETREPSEQFEETKLSTKLEELPTSDDTPSNTSLGDSKTISEPDVVTT